MTVSLKDQSQILKLITHKHRTVTPVVLQHHRSMGYLTVEVKEKEEGKCKKTKKTNVGRFAVFHGPINSTHGMIHHHISLHNNNQLNIIMCKILAALIYEEILRILGEITCTDKKQKKTN